MTEEKPLIEKIFTANNKSKTFIELAELKIILASAVEKEHNLLIKLRDDVITWDEFWIARDEIFGNLNQPSHVPWD